MNIVQHGPQFQIYSNDIQTSKKLPVKTYDICFNKFSGWFLEEHVELEVREEKIYGSTPVKVKKVLNTFKDFDRNCGVILSGAKGIGKSLFARLLSIEGAKEGYPLLIVSKYMPGLVDFLSSIEQECIVLFDEFEKTHSSKMDGDINPQEELLSLFDGIDNGKKLFVITCNETYKLNSYLLNRPGRFHYHFTMSPPSIEEVEEYLRDNITEEYSSTIAEVVRFASYVDVTYDMLRAIVFELNRGYSFSETLQDLNIKREDAPEYNVAITLATGEVITEQYKIDVFSNVESNHYFYPKCGSYWRLRWADNDWHADPATTGLIIDLNDVKISCDEGDFDNDEKRIEWEKRNAIVDIHATKVIKTYAKYLDV